MDYLRIEGRIEGRKEGGKEGGREGGREGRGWEVGEEGEGGERYLPHIKGMQVTYLKPRCSAVVNGTQSPMIPCTSIYGGV